MELTNSQYGKLVDSYVQARTSLCGNPAVAEAEMETAAIVTAEQIREDPVNSAGWNSELWDALIVGLNEDGVLESEIDAIARRCGEIAGVPLPTLP